MCSRGDPKGGQGLLTSGDCRNIAAGLFEPSAAPKGCPHQPMMAAVPISRTPSQVVCVLSCSEIAGLSSVEGICAAIRGGLTSNPYLRWTCATYSTTV